MIMAYLHKGKGNILELQDKFMQCSKWDPEARDFVTSNSLSQKPSKEATLQFKEKVTNVLGI